MRISICLLIVCITTIVLTQGKPYTVKNKLEPSVSVSLNSNAIGLIPAFSLDNPAIMASVMT